jgi:hypothetical protein
VDVIIPATGKNGIKAQLMMLAANDIFDNVNAPDECHQYSRNDRLEIMSM